MFRRIDHVGIVAASWQEARGVFLDLLGFEIEESRGAGEEGRLFPPENTRNYFIQVGEGDTVVEIIVPQDTKSGAARFLERRGAGLHHIGYAVDDVAADAKVLRDRGLQQIDLNVPNPTAAFFYPKQTMGVLTELVPVHNRNARLHTGSESAAR